jgi:hypothetical protein
MISTKTNRLSTESEYSVIQPAKNSPPYCGPATASTPSPNAMASETYTITQIVDSRIDGSRGLRATR